MSYLPIFKIFFCQSFVGLDVTGVFDIPKFVTSVHLYMKGISTGRRDSKRRWIIGVKIALDVIL